MIGDDHVWCQMGPYISGKCTWSWLQIRQITVGKWQVDKKITNIVWCRRVGILHDDCAMLDNMIARGIVQSTTSCRIGYNVVFNQNILAAIFHADPRRIVIFP